MLIDFAPVINICLIYRFPAQKTEKKPVIQKRDKPESVLIVERINCINRLKR